MFLARPPVIMAAVACRLTRLRKMPPFMGISGATGVKKPRYQQD
jgi:hypothetical protein